MNRDAAVNTVLDPIHDPPSIEGWIAVPIFAAQVVYRLGPAYSDPELAAVTEWSFEPIEAEDLVDLKTVRRKIRQPSGPLPHAVVYAPPGSVFQKRHRFSPLLLYVAPEVDWFPGMNAEECLLNAARRVDFRFAEDFGRIGGGE